MERITLIIAEKEREYIDLFMKYVRETEYIRKFNIKTFSSKENLEGFFKRQKKTDILLTIPEFITGNLEVGKIEVTILLSEKNKIDENENLPVLFKYQPLNQILSKILSIYTENCENGKLRIIGDNKVNVITVCSASGGNGKTTVAINLASKIALRDKKVLYLNLEFFNSTGIFFPLKGSDDLSRILYYLKTDSNDLVNKIDELKNYDLESKIEYFEPFSNSYELFDLTREDLKILIDSIEKLGRYDYLIIDLDILKSDFFVSAFTRSDNIIWLVLDNIQDLHKTKLFKDNLIFLLDDRYEEVSEKILFTMNKFLGRNVQNDLSKYEINLFGYLPYISEWKVVTDKNQLLNNLLFNSKLDKLFINLFK